MRLAPALIIKGRVDPLGDLSNLGAERGPELGQVPEGVLSIVELLLQVSLLDGQTLLRHVGLVQSSLERLVIFSTAVGNRTCQRKKCGQMISTKICQSFEKFSSNSNDGNRKNRCKYINFLPNNLSMSKRSTNFFAKASVVRCSTITNYNAKLLLQRRKDMTLAP